MDGSLQNKMKYFTKNWCWGDLDEKQVEEISLNYDKYIKKIYPLLPFSLKLIARNISFHDGILKGITISPSKKALTLEGIFGDLDWGYFDLRIDYKVVTEFSTENIKDKLGDQHLEIIRDELELVKKENEPTYIHSFIFSNKIEFQIEFYDCALAISNADQKKYTKKRCCVKIE